MRGLFPNLFTPATRRGLLGALTMAALATGLVTTGCSQTTAAPDSVSLEDARKEVESGRAILIDVREPEEHARGVVAGARLLPMRQMDQRWAEVPTDPSRPVLLICHSQHRSSATLHQLRTRGGYQHVRYVEGGMSGWAARGWPTVTPPASPAP